MKRFSPSKLFRFAARAARRRRSAGNAIEPLEARIAPATLLSPTTVTFLEGNGDTATVQLSKPLFTAGNVGKVFTFDTGSFTGGNSTAQQLETLNITALGAVAARGIDITITAPTSGGVFGPVNVGYINASNIDLGNVSVDGDLGRIAVGDQNVSTPGLHSLTVDSLGAEGLTTQGPGGTLNSLISGGVASITVNGSIYNASIGIGGGAKGILGSLTVLGSVVGGSAARSGSVDTQGGISNVMVGGSIVGGGGADSGVIGTAGVLGTVVIEGSVLGGPGLFSGAILSTKEMQSASIAGNLTGGSGPDSGQLGTAADLQNVAIGGSVAGGLGKISGAILAGGNMASVTIANGLLGGSGADSGQVGSGKTIQAITVGDGGTGIQGIVGGLGAGSGAIIAHADIGSVRIARVMAAGATIEALQNIQSVQVNVTASGQSDSGISDSFIIARNGSIGSVLAGGSGYASAYSISNSIIQAGANIGSIEAIQSGDSAPAAFAILDAGIDAGGNIGPIKATGSIDGSVFVAGIDLGTAFNVNGAGSFNSSGASFGFGASKSPVAASIGNITANGLIERSTFLAGVHGTGPDGKLGTKDDTVPTGSSIGAIYSPGGLNTVFVESGDIGPTTSGAIVATNYLSTDTAVSAAGIGAISVTASITPAVGAKFGSAAKAAQSTITNEAIANSIFSSNAGIGDITLTLEGIRTAGTNAGIASSAFEAGHALGTISVTDDATGSAGVNYGIFNATFNGGLDGYGGTSDISATLTDDGPAANSAAIAYSDFDASVCSCMSANMGSIAANNSGTSASAAGILDSVFRVHGSIGPISADMTSGSPTAAAIEGTTFSAFGSIGDINVYGAVVADSKGKPSRFLAGYDIGTDMVFGNEDLSAKSLALHSGQSVGNVSVSGYFSGSDLIASINPGADYVFGDSIPGTSANNNTSVGTGGSIGLVAIGYNVPLDGSPFSGDTAASHAIEAAKFAIAEGTIPMVTAFGNTSAIPVLLSYTDGGGEVRITNLTQAIG